MREVIRLTVSSPEKKSVLCFLAAAVLFAILMTFFGYLSLERFIAKDEGFYVVASKLLLQEGLLPYRDYFYPQMPYLPPVYAGVFALFGTSWEVARFAAAFVASLIGLLLFEIVRAEVGRGWGLFSVVLFASSVFVFPWFPTVQTYGLSCFFLLACTHLFSVGVRSERKLLLVFAGLFFGVAVGVRLIFFGLIPVFLWFVRRELWSKALPFLCGTFLALLPFLALFILYPDQSYFNNLGYHLLRSSDSLEQALSHKYKILLNLLGLRESVQFSGYQMPILIVVSFGSLLLARKSFPVVFFGAVGFGLFFLHFLPSPNYNQYFCTVVPFLSICSALGLAVFFQRYPSRVFIVPTLAVLLVSYLLPLPSEIKRFTESGKGVIGIRSTLDIERWKIKFLGELSEKLEALPTDSQILSLWPGWLLETEINNFPGTENHFGPRVADGVSAEQRKLYRILSFSEQRALLESGEIEYVLGERKLFSELQFSQVKEHFERVWTKEQIELWRRKELGEHL